MGVYAVFPKSLATSVMSSMFTLPSLLRSAMGFQFESPGLEPNAFATMVMSMMLTFPLPSRSVAKADRTLKVPCMIPLWYWQ